MCTAILIIPKSLSLSFFILEKQIQIYSFVINVTHILDKQTSPNKTQVW